MSNTSPIKLTEDELQKFKEISATYNQVLMKFGELHIEKIGLNKAVELLRTKEDDLTKLFEDTQVAEKTHIDAILSKYGEGNLSLSDGTFTPTESK